MSVYRSPRPRSQLEAAYAGLPDADASLPLSKAVASIRAALYDLHNSADNKFRFGANEIDSRWRLAAKRRTAPIPGDFQAAIDHLASSGELAALETSRGTCYFLTASGCLQEEALRVPPWGRLARALPAGGRYVAAG